MNTDAIVDTDATQNVGVRTTVGEWVGLVALVAAQLAFRLQFLPRVRETGDALYYSVGALYTHVAHPPGSVGYCLLLGWVNLLVHDIRITLTLVSTVAGTAAVVLCHRVAKRVGLNRMSALAAAAIYGFSATTLQASLQGTPHELEGMMSLTFGLLAWQAARSGRFGVGLAASFVFAIAGAFRPTTTLLLAPLWGYMLWHVRAASFVGRARQFALHLLIVVPIVAAWSWGNAHFITANGYGGQTYANQVVSASTYDYDNLSATARNGRAVSQATFHMPGAELLAWTELKTGLRLLPHTPDWPTPSPTRAFRLLAMQAAKQAWWITFSLPLVWCAAALALFHRRSLHRPPARVNRFVMVWIAPPVLFFVFGHMGMLTYVQIYLGALCVWITWLLLGPGSATGTATGTEPGPRVSRFAVAAFIVVLAGEVAFFGLSRPFQAASGWKRMADLLALQFDGYSRRTGFWTARSNGNVATNLQAVDGPDHDYLVARTDREFLIAAERSHYPYAIFPGATSTTHPAVVPLPE